ncbi:MAG: permease-like cell division protein FtsX [Thermoanaerobaculia bacterium]
MVSLGRSWKLSLLAVVTIAMSVFMGGSFLLLTNNLQRLLSDWRGEAKIVVYLNPNLDGAERRRLKEELSGSSWVTDLREVSADEARVRFEQIFPSVAELLEGLRDEPIPPSLELGFHAEAADQEKFREWLAGIRVAPGVLVVDDDRDWLRQLETLVAALRGLGLAIGAALLGAAIFTIASVIRLTTYLHRDEIAVMRLVGATELFIRGPFYCEGLIQGFAGGLGAVGALYVSFTLLDPSSTTSLLGTVLVRQFLSTGQLATLLVLGASAGLLGSIVSLRRGTD